MLIEKARRPRRPQSAEQSECMGEVGEARVAGEKRSSQTGSREDRSQMSL